MIILKTCVKLLLDKRAHSDKYPCRAERKPYATDPYRSNPCRCLHYYSVVSSLHSTHTIKCFYGFIKSRQFAISVKIYSIQTNCCVLNINITANENKKEISFVK